MTLEPTTNFKDSNGVDLGTKLITKDYLISVYPEIGSQIGIPPELWVWGRGVNGQLGNATNTTTNSTPVTTFSGGTDWKQVSSGGYHTTAIKTDGTLWVWGNGGNGKLGNAATNNRSVPLTTFSGGTDWKQVSGGFFHTAAIKTDGTLWVWGSGVIGQLGNATTTLNNSTPVTTFTGGTDWKQVSAGYNHTVAIKTDGTLWTWGNGSSGRLGNNVFISFNRSTPVTTFAGGTNWADTATTNPEDLYTLSAGNAHTAAIKTDGTLWTWGNGTIGQLGNATFTPINSTPVTTFVGGTNWKQLSAGFQITAAIKTDGTLWTWGYGNFGRLGNASVVTRSTPLTTFAGGTNWKQVSTGGLQIAAIKTDGTLWSWGSGTFGSLGNATVSLINSTPVTTFAGGTDWKQISCGGYHTAAIKTDGTLWTWGYGNFGRLGDAAEFNRSTPVTTFAGGTNWKQISAGGSHTTAIKTDGTLWTWGNGTFGRLGNSVTTNASTPVTTFAGGTNWNQVSAGNQHTTAIKTDGTLWAWGRETYGRLGNGVTTGNISTPVTTFTGGTNWKQVSGGDFHTIALRDDGINKELFTWGNDANSGRLGNAIIVIVSTPVTTFSGGTNWKQVSSGDSHTAAIKTDGTLWTWGDGTKGQLGITDLTDRSAPVTTFAGGTNWKQVSSGGSYTLAIKTDGTLWSWGNKSSSALGYVYELLTNKSTPITTFAGGTNWADTATTEPEDLYTLSAGLNFTSAIKTDGTLWTWGNGQFGRLGNATTTTINSTPVTTFAGGTNWKQVSCGSNHTAAIKTDGTLWAWGVGGRFGNGIISGIGISTPVTTFAGGTNWKQVSSGGSHTAAIKTDGTLWTSGFGVNGQLGNIVTTDRSTPITTFAGGTNWKQVSSANGHTAAIKTDGTLWTWGNGTNGQLGTLENLTGIRSTPITTFAGGTNWADTATGVAEELYTLSAGVSYTAAIKTDGTLWIWGNGQFGQLGNADTTDILTPSITFAGGTDWKQVSVGNQHTTAIKTDGTLWTWGNGNSGRLGNTIIINTVVSTPITTFSGGTNWKQVSGGNFHTAAIKTDGTLWTWGNGAPLLGNGVTTGNISTPITTFAGGTNWKQVSGGSLHTAAIKTDGTLWTWGISTQSQLGNAVTVISSISTPITTFAGGTDWKQVSSGWYHTAAIKTDGTLWTWGYGGQGRLGHAATTDRSTPVTTFTGGTNWKQVSAGNQHTTAIKTDGTLWTWGWGSSGRLGNADTTDRSTPITTFTGGTNWKQVSAGNSHTVALRDDGINKELFVWGNNTFSQLGTLITSNNVIPNQTFQQTTDWKQVSAGYQYTAAIKTDGTLWTWGNGNFGRLGNATTTTINSTPVTTFAGGTNWKQVSAGDAHTAAIKTDGTLWSWGNGGSGRLGNAVTTNVSTPITTFSGGTNWKQVSSGGSYTVALRDDGINKELFVWGNGSFGQLGDNERLLNDTSPTSTPITTFAGGTNWKQVDAGNIHTSAIKTDGTLWTWGNGTNGRLGNSVTTNASTPVTTFAGGTNWNQVSAGGFHTSAIQSVDF